MIFDVLICVAVVFCVWYPVWVSVVVLFCGIGVLVVSCALCLSRLFTSAPCQSSRSHHDLYPRRNRYKLCAETLIWNSGGVLAETCQNDLVHKRKLLFTPQLTSQVPGE